VSPDGHWAAYVSTESGRAEVYVDSFPKPDTRITVSTSGGTQPRWRRDGRELFYLLSSAGGIDTAMAVAVESTGTGLRFGIPKNLFDMGRAPSAHAVSAYSYAVTSDGQRFLVARLPGETGSSAFERPVAVVINWDAGLAGGR
jgi:hypothetical protein